jgi:hypothetical protein
VGVVERQVALGDGHYGDFGRRWRHLAAVARAAAGERAACERNE